MQRIIIATLMSILVFGCYGQDFCALIDAGHGLLIGGTNKGILLAQDKAAGLMSGKENYKLYSLSGFLRSAAGARPENGLEPCTEQYFVDIGIEADYSEVIIGLSCSWDPLPKVLKIQSTQQETYNLVVYEMLKKRGISNPVVNVTAIIRTDLEGDGTEEVVISATRYSGSNPADAMPGDYSLIFVRKIINGKVENIVLDETVYADKAEFSAPLRFKPVAILDIDHDGIMEVLISSDYYEGHSIRVFHLNSENKAIELLNAGCGA